MKRLLFILGISLAPNIFFAMEQQHSNTMPTNIMPGQSSESSTPVRSAAYISCRGRVLNQRRTRGAAMRGGPSEATFCSAGNHASTGSCDITCHVSIRGGISVRRGTRGPGAHKP